MRYFAVCLMCGKTVVGGKVRIICLCPACKKQVGRVIKLLNKLKGGDKQ